MNSIFENLDLGSIILIGLLIGFGIGYLTRFKRTIDEDYVFFPEKRWWKTKHYSFSEIRKVKQKATTENTLAKF